MPCTFSFQNHSDLLLKGSTPFSVGLHVLMPGPRIVHALTSSFFRLPSSFFHHFTQAGRFHLLGEGREQSAFVSVSEPSSCVLLLAFCHPISGGSVPDEAGPGVAAGVAKVDDQGQIAVVDGDLGEANDASDALLFRCAC
jgi:hypothetical protein